MSQTWKILYIFLFFLYRQVMNAWFNHKTLLSITKVLLVELTDTFYYIQHETLKCVAHMYFVITKLMCFLVNHYFICDLLLEYYRRLSKQRFAIVNFQCKTHFLCCPKFKVYKWKIILVFSGIFQEHV